MVVLLRVLRYQVDTVLSPLPHMLGLGVFGQRGVVSGRIVEEPERGDDRVRFVVALEKVETDSTLYIGKAEQVVAIERLPGYWLDEQLLLPGRGAVREAIERIDLALPG